MQGYVSAGGSCSVCRSTIVELRGSIDANDDATLSIYISNIGLHDEYSTCHQHINGMHRDALQRQKL